MEAQNQSTDTSTVTLADVADLILQHYRQELCQAIKASLGVVASLSLKKRDHCLVVVFEGPSGRGKSIVIRVTMPDRESTGNYLLRVDDFTPASFVSHASNRNTKQLDKIDLLPKLKDKVMLTKELAPLFRDDEKELRQNFARLTSILDGDGYKTQSGMHGARGYDGRYVFNWIGATTPIPQRTHKIMAQLGNRILIYEIAGEDTSEDDLMEFARSYGTNDTVAECCKLVNDFVDAHFLQHPIESVDPESIAIPDELLRELIRYAKLISCGRVEVERHDRGTLEVGPAEGPQRIILLLQTLARGLALADGRTAVAGDDLSLIRHIAFSSIPTKRRELLRALLAGGGTLDSSQVEAALDTSRPTALNRIRELGATGIAVYSEGDPKSSTPASITLADEWKWLQDGGTPPLKESGV